jgi:trimethylamine--corrinoid protein Co-methyltransferase
MKTGMKGGNLTIVSEAELDRIYEASLSLLMEPGMLSDSDLILDLFEKSEAQVDRATRRIRVPRQMVEAAIQSAPSSFILHGRNDPAMDLLLEPGRVYYGMGGTSEPLFWDWDARQPRQPTKQDMIHNTRIGHALTYMDFVQTLCMSGDQPTHETFFHDFDAIFRNTTKPTVINILERPFTQHLLAMLAAVSGGESELRDKPSALGIVTPISPLKFPEMNEGIIDVVQAGVPVLYSPGPLMGATSPATVAGTVVLTNAEVLFGLTLTQLIRPGAKIVLKPDTDVFDMRTTQVTYDSPEQNLGKIAMVQLAKRYRLPIYGLAGGVECKTPDGEAAAEAMMGMLLNGLAGMTLNQSLGTLSFGLYGSPEMAVICDEIAHMIRRVLDGMSVNEDTLAVDIIREVGPAGDFLSHAHTVRHFRKEMWFPRLFKRQTIDEWTQAGGKMIHESAHEKVLEILSKAEAVNLPPDVDAELERAFNQARQWSAAQRQA